jgi:hypothetical protein
MSKVKLTGHVSGTGVLTVTSPDTDTDRTITLPDATGTLATTDDTTDLDGAVVINESGADVDFRVESDDNANMLFVDGGEDAVLIGHNASDGKGASLQIHGTGGHALEISRWVDSANGVNLTLTKSRGASVGTEGIVSDDDTAGQIAWNVDDGTDQASQIATIKAAVDGTPGANDTPGRLVFSTTADGSDSSTERMRIDSSGNITKPTQPCWSVTCPGQTNISQGAYDDLILNNEIYDVGSNYNTGTYEFTAPVTGKYFISVHFKMEQIQNGASYIRFLLTTSNRGYSAQLDPRVFDTDGDYWSVYITQLCDLDANDVAYARFKQIGGESHMDVSTESMMTGILLA